VILGMDCLSKHNGLVNFAKKAIRLTPSSGKELEYVVENLVTDKAASNRIVLNHLDATSTLDQHCLRISGCFSRRIVRYATGL
jgi:hypothetical protein